MKQRKDFPFLMKRTHFIRDMGLSNSLFYSLLHSGILPTVSINGHNYILRDEFFDLLEDGLKSDCPLKSV